MKKSNSPISIVDAKNKRNSHLLNFHLECDFKKASHIRIRVINILLFDKLLML